MGGDSLSCNLAEIKAFWVAIREAPLFYSHPDHIILHGNLRILLTDCQRTRFPEFADQPGLC